MRLRHLLPGAALTVGAALFWVILAMRTPTSTHHFAPLVVAAAWGVVYRQYVPAPPPVQRAVVGLGGAAVGLTAFLFLAAIGRLNGPPLIANVPVSTELPGMAIVGGLIGAGLHRVWRWDQDAKLAPDSSGTTEPGVQP